MRTRNIGLRMACRLAMVTMIAVVGCADADSQNNIPPPQPAASATPQWGAYWNQGKAELTHFALEQARYGEIHNGDAMLIFVTEDFDADRQVKLESDPAGRNIVGVLKLNMTKKFITGIYPYSMMTSVFTPVDRTRNSATIKVTSSSQEWCGQTWTQFNLRGGKYELETRSYFEKEGDASKSLDAVLLEDELFTLIRLGPSTLPLGTISIIPSAMTARLRHIPLDVEQAEAKIEDAAADSVLGAIRRYTVTYPKSERRLVIEFQRDFPYRIAGWSETYRDGFGPNPELLTTRARRTHELMIDYWRHNSTSDDSLREKLGIGEDSTIGN